MSDPRPWDLIAHWRDPSRWMNRTPDEVGAICADQLEVTLRGMAGELQKRIDTIDSTFTNRKDIPWPEPGYIKNDDRVAMLVELRVLNRIARELLSPSGEGGRDG